MITREVAIKLAAELNLPEPLQRLARGETLESNLDIFWGNAEEFFISSAKSAAPVWEDKIVPLWDNGNFDKIYGIHLSSGKFVEFYIEEDFSPDELPGWNYQQILLPTFQDIYELYIDDGEEKCEQELNYQANLFGFRYVKELIEIGRINWNDYDNFERELDEFRETLK